MPRILLVKTSSLGDIVHNFPMVTDVKRWIPDAEIHWAVEESFADLPALHPGVAQTVTVALRRWRRLLLRPSTWKEISRVRNAIRSQRYDIVIDTQGLLKSALVCLCATGQKFGYDWKSSREPLRPFYSKTYAIPREMHAVERNRLLAATALGYSAGEKAEFGIRADSELIASEDWFGELQGRPYAVFLHATSAEKKLWPEHQWSKLGAYAAGKGLRIVLPWASTDEHLRSSRLAQLIPKSMVPPRLGLDKVAALLGGSRLVVGVDTGLTHLAAALAAPTVGIFAATNPTRTGVYGSDKAVTVGTGESAPPLSEVLDAIRRMELAL